MEQAEENNVYLRDTESESIHITEDEVQEVADRHSTQEERGTREGAHAHNDGK